LAKIIENQGEIFYEIRELKSKVRRIENRLSELEQKMENKFDFKNEKTFKEVII